MLDSPPSLCSGGRGLVWCEWGVCGGGGGEMAEEGVEGGGWWGGLSSEEGLVGTVTR